MAPSRLLLGGEPVRIRVRRDLGKPELLREPRGRRLLLLPLGAPEDAGERFISAWQAADADMLRPPLPPDVFLESLRASAVPLCDRLGVAAPRLLLSEGSGRWGSCDPARGLVRVHGALAAYPCLVAEEVLAHELCHLRVPDHGPAFWQLLTQVFPLWCEAEGTLRSLAPARKKQKKPGAPS